jgi:hypothetical protein
MRNARRSFLLLVATAAAMALTAPAAWAEIEVLNEHTGTHCPTVTNDGGEIEGGCNVHLHGEVTLRYHFFGIEVTDSVDYRELEARIDEDGNGWIYMATFASTGPAPYNTVQHSGLRQPCGLPSAVRLEEDGAVEALHVEFCADPDNPANPDGDEDRYEVEAPIVDTGDHDYELPLSDLSSVDHLTGGGAYELNGELHMEASEYDEVEIIH